MNNGNHEDIRKKMESEWVYCVLTFKVCFLEVADCD